MDSTAPDNDSAKNWRASNPTLYWLLIRPLGWLDRNTEKVIILVAYGLMAGIIFIEVIRRFGFGQQAAWSTSIPVYMFLWLAWFGTSYNVRKRTHLSLSELRERFNYHVQYLCLLLDSVLWIVFATVVIYWSWGQVQMSKMNWATVAGTDDVMQWWFYLALPLAWGMIIIRSLQNMVLDTMSYRRREELPISKSLLD